MQKIKYYLAPILGLSIAIPLLALFVYFITKGDFTFQNIPKEELFLYTKNTLFIVFGSSFGVMLLGICSAYASARFDYFGRKFFALCFVLPLAFPAYIIGYSYVGLFEFKGLFSQLFDLSTFSLDILNIYGVTCILSLAMFPYVYILARISFSSISSTVVELVSLQNISSIKAFFSVYLPLAYPAIFGGTILAIMEVLSDYGTVAYFGIDTFSVGIFKSWFGYGNLPEAINLAMVMLCLVFILLLIESQIRSKYRFISSTHSSKRASSIKLYGWKNFLAFFISFFIASISLFIPLGILLYWLFLDMYTLDLSILSYLYNTLSLNIFASFIIISLSFIMVYLLRFYSTKLSFLTHKLSMLGYSIPGAVIGIGMLLFVNFIDQKVGKILLGGSFFALVFAYLTRYFAASIGSVENGFSKIDKTIDDASKVFGKGEIHTFFSVYLPLMKPYLLSGFLILYIDIAKELPATLLLRPFNFDTMAIRIYELASNEMLYKIAAPSLLLVLTTAIAVFLLNSKFVRGKR